jgi:tRNA U34 5-methylaminomethyl-2-thiouridine-forming methyltransferase MnmC
MEMDVPAVVETADGSITCLDAGTGELYHNRAGAVAEAMHNFVRPLSLERFGSERLRVLDVPFGLGYNSFVLLQEVFACGKFHDLSSIEIVAVEQDRAVLTLLERVLLDDKFELLRTQLGFSSDVDSEFDAALLSSSRLEHFCQTLQSSNVYEARVGKTHLRISVKQGDMRVIVPLLAEDGPRFDFIMHDPFSPNKMPELWTIDLFQRYRQMLMPGGRLTTYSVAFAVRAALLQTGFTIFDTAAVGAKSGGTLAVAGALSEEDRPLAAVSTEIMERLRGRSGVPYRDPFFALSRAEIRQKRIEEQEQFFPLKV